jgi:apolipoprotein N-acyltransferase
MGGVNARGVITGEVFTVEGRTLYNRFGDWFGILVSMLLAVGIIFGSSRAGIYARSKVCCSV